MADSKEMMVEPYRNLLQELPSFADHTALLYHLSFLYLAKFPSLQMTLRECAVQTQDLFASCEYLLIKCESASDEMVVLVLPQLKQAVENDDTADSTWNLDIAKGWITEIVRSVKEIVDSYEKHTRSVSSCTSDVSDENSEMGRTTKEIETLEKVVKDLQMELSNTLKEIGQIEAQIGERTLPRIASNTMSDLAVLTAILPFAGAIVKSMSKPMAGLVRPLFNQRAQLFAQRSNLTSQQYNIQDRLTDAHLKLANLRTKKGSNLNNVQKWLYQIQQTLMQHIVFWKSVQVVMESNSDETFANDHFIADSELKGIFLTQIDSAQEQWKAFGESCLKAKKLFILQDKDAYDFLYG